jgi:NTP pyrophosphatase (non-canonical NTP hydrolase)
MISVLLTLMGLLVIQESYANMNDKTTTIKDIQDKVTEFIDARNWRQYHSPLNMAINLTVEASELLEIFTWCDKKDSYKAVDAKREAIEHEVADVLYNLVDFCKQANIDLAAAFEKKMQLNEKKYPVEKSYGSEKKYTEL